MENNIKICCPNCSHEFSIEIEGLIAANVESDIRKKVELELKNKMDSLNEVIHSKDVQLAQMTEMELEKAELVKKLANAKEQANIDARKELVGKEAEIKNEAERIAKERAELDFMEKERLMKIQIEEIELTAKRNSIELMNKIREEEKMKHAELQDKLDRQIKLADEMKRKAEQGSMQSQGEIQELELERMLTDAFPFDEITEIGKGKRGADVLQLVRTNTGHECGKIYYESKRTKDFKEHWIGKLKEDNLEMNADILVIATDVMPEGQSRFYFQDGVWICSFRETKALSVVLRFGLLQMQNLRITQHGRESKAELLYNFITSTEFKGQLESIFEGFSDLRDAHNREKTQMQKIWKEREKQLERILSNAAGFYGSMRGIAGAAVPEMKMLVPELEEVEL